MADAPKKPHSRLRFGCLGLLGLGAILLVAGGTLFGTAFWRGQNEVVETRELQTEPLNTTETPTAGRVVLDLTVGDFNVVSGDPGEPIHVEAEFDTRSYVLRENFARAGSGWEYRVSFAETAWFKDGGLRAVLGGSFPKITVTLPPDVPIALTGRFGKGVASLDLGGLWLTDIDLEFERGVMMVEFNHPLVTPVERISIRNRQGYTVTRLLGNASPRTLEIDQWMGGLQVDLHGAWVRDAQVRVAGFLVGNEILLTNDADIQGLSQARGPKAPHLAELPRPKLDLSVSSLLSRLSVVECEEEPRLPGRQDSDENDQTDRKEDGK